MAALLESALVLGGKVRSTGTPFGGTAQPGSAGQPGSMVEPGNAAQPVPTPQRGRPKENRRLALLSAAASLFPLNGFTRFSLEDFGAAAGVGGPGVYRHF